MWHTIVNPKTGRKVSVTGKIGKKILRNYISHLNGGAGPSDARGYLEMNPENTFSFRSDNTLSPTENHKKENILDKNGGPSDARGYLEMNPENTFSFRSDNTLSPTENHKKENILDKNCGTNCQEESQKRNKFLGKQLMLDNAFRKDTEDHQKTDSFRMYIWDKVYVLMRMSYIDNDQAWSFYSEEDLRTKQAGYMKKRLEKKMKVNLDNFEEELKDIMSEIRKLPEFNINLDRNTKEARVSYMLDSKFKNKKIRVKVAYQGIYDDIWAWEEAGCPELCGQGGTWRFKYE